MVVVLPSTLAAMDANRTNALVIQHGLALLRSLSFAGENEVSATGWVMVLQGLLVVELLLSSRRCVVIREKVVPAPRPSPSPSRRH